MKNFITILFLAVTTFSFSQVTGDIIESERKVKEPVNFNVERSYYAKIVIDIAVNIDGEVTSATLNKNASTKNSTPLTIECVGRAKNLKFEKGNHFPKFHNGKVIFNVAPTNEK